MLPAQDYVAAPVTISKEKVKNNGKIYYSHVVLEKQTLFSIAKTYGVTIQEIYEANPTLNLEQEGLKKDEIILIPIKVQDENKKQDKNNNSQIDEGKSGTVASAKTKSFSNIGVKNLPEENRTGKTQPDKNDYVLHIVKWYENLDDIAKKYGIPAEMIVQFNGLKDKSVKRKQVLKIPTHPELLQIDEREQKEKTSIDDKIQNAINSIKQGEAGQDAKIQNNSSKTVKATLIMPFGGSTGKINDNSLDFYSGMLLAVRDLGNAGIGTELNVYDASIAPSAVTSERLASSDVIIGPSSISEISKTLEICPSSANMVSPLDPKAASLAFSHKNLIQAPTSANVQYQDLVNWIREDRKADDRVILVTEKGAKSNTLASLVEKSGIPFNRVSYAIIESGNTIGTFSSIMSRTGVNRVIVASESEAFVNDLVRNLVLMLHKGTEIVLYSPSKIRSFETIDVDAFHKLDLHVSAGYHIDYDNPRVQHFVLDYRSLFNTDPSQFAFQGYDIAYYFISRYARYGDFGNDDAIRQIEELQTDFKFERAGNGGYVNMAVRRIVYNADYSVSLIRR